MGLKEVRHEHIKWHVVDKFGKLLNSYSTRKRARKVALEMREAEPGRGWKVVRVDESDRQGR